MFFSPVNTNAQNNNLQPSFHQKLMRHWSVNINGGITSYFGDLSHYDNSFSGKIEYESGNGFGVVLSKKLNKAISLSGQIIAGKIKGKSNNISFESTLFEYNMHLRTDLIQLMKPGKNPAFGIDLFAGMGHFIFKTQKEEYIEGGILTTNHKSRVPEFVYFFGTGVKYNFTHKVDLNLEVSIHQFQNDKIDIVHANDDFDYFSYLQIGFTYHLEYLKRPEVRNKARIAHNNAFLKPLN
jgi:opacity protein-like surface antigen